MRICAGMHVCMCIMNSVQHAGVQRIAGSKQCIASARRFIMAQERVRVGMLGLQ
jgi:hypothetical protein